MIRFIAILLVGLLGVVAYWFSDSTRARTVSGIFDTLINGGDSINQAAFERRAITAVNAGRAELGLPALGDDPEIHDALARFAAGQERMAEMEFATLFASLQRDFPSAQFLSATVLLDPRDDGLAKSLAKWEDALSPQFATLCTLAFRDGVRKGCIAVLARRLPLFDLETSNRDGGRYYQICPWCGHTHAVLLDKKSHTLILSCPRCGKPYDVLAVDTEGDFRRATDFFDGFRLPAIRGETATGDDIADEQLMVEIWSSVLRHNDYEYDSAGQNQTEAWKRPSQTWTDAAGDCEDTAILLADALISAGIDARVAIGWNTRIGQHAWTVARIGDRQWVLESTLQLKADEQPVPVDVAKAAKEYQPEQLFDREGLYFRTDGKVRGDCGDYWSANLWEPLPKR